MTLSSGPQPGTILNPPEQSWWLQVRDALPRAAGVLLFAILVGGVAWRYDHFFSVGTFCDMLGDNSFLGIVGVGMTLVLLTGGIDLSVGSVLALSTVLLTKMMMQWHWGFAQAAVCTLGVGGAIGLASGVMIHYAKLKPFLVTLAAMFLARGLAYLFSIETESIDEPLHNRLRSIHVDLTDADSLGVPAMLLVTVVLAAWYLCARTSMGRNLYAIGGNEDSALLMGAPVARTKIAAYTLSGLCAALGGIVMTLYSPTSDPSAGMGMELDAIAAAVIGGAMLTGGVGSVVGTVMGVLSIGLISSIVKNYEGLSPGLSRIVIGTLLLGFVCLQRLLSGSRDPA
ncbi:MAG: sugar ABC transporter permease YjfF [Pyrinomonadaceae bacterium]|nr:sugar ABC transporter permease YjfF [Phycisphaerales bacterium]